VEKFVENFPPCFVIVSLYMLRYMKYTQGLWWGLFLASEKSIKVKEKMGLLKLMSSPTSEYNGSVGGLICDWDLRSNVVLLGLKFINVLQPNSYCHELIHISW